MELALSVFARDHRILVEVCSGAFLGLCSAFVVLILFSRMTQLSTLPLPLFPKYVFVSVAATFLRVLSLSLPVGFAGIVTSVWAMRVLRAPHIMGFHPSFTFRALFIGVPLVTITGLAVWLTVLMLDRRLGVNSSSSNFDEVFKKAYEAGWVSKPIERHLLSRILFMTASATQLKEIISYGGVIVRPRIVIPTQIMAKLDEPSLVALLVREVAHIRRVDCFFYSIFNLTQPKIIRNWHFRLCEFPVLIETLARVPRDLLKAGLELEGIEERVITGLFLKINTDGQAFKQKEQFRRLLGVLGLLAVLLAGWFGFQEVDSSIDYHKNYKQNLTRMPVRIQEK